MLVGWGNAAKIKGYKVTQYGKKNAWFVYDESKNMGVFISYNTAVVAVDFRDNYIYLGKHARGYSRTTTKQVTQFIGEMQRMPYMFGIRIDKKFKVCSVLDYGEIFCSLPDRWDDLEHAEYALLNW